jgi:hypothetical protein
MRKSIPKLVLRKETVRTLATVDLVRVQGGSNANTAPAIEETTPKQCTGAAAAAVVAPGG